MELTHKENTLLEMLLKVPPGLLFRVRFDRPLIVIPPERCFHFTPLRRFTQLLG